MSNETPDRESLVGASPYAKALMKAMGGDPRFMSAHPERVRRWGQDRPESVLNLIPDLSFVSVVESIPLEYLDKSEEELVNECYPNPPGRTERRVRLAFWDEYERAATNFKQMDLDAIIPGTGARSWPSFADQITRSPALLMWFMNPPAGYKLQIREAQELGLTRIQEIMELPIKDPATGRVNTAVAALILQAWRLMDVRLHGMPTQKIAQINQTVPNAPGASVSVNQNELDKKLAELERMLASTALAVVPSPEKPPEQEVSSEAVSPG